jgi:IPT/TIG domain
VDTSLSVSVRSEPTQVTSISPNAVSPVLKTLLTIRVTNYPSTLDKNDLEVRVESRGTPQIVRAINVVEVGVDGSDQIIKVKFGGSESGVYDLKVRSRSYGNFDATGITLTTVGNVTDFNPKQGSVYGGTLITVNGYYFSDDYMDNPIRIGYTDCMVEYSSPTLLKCRTEARVQETTGTEDFIVFLKTYEEAVCGVDGGCKFTWVDNAQLTNYSVDFDTNENQYVLTLTGSGFAATTDNTEVLIDNLKQEIISASDSEIRVRIVNMLNSTSFNTDIHLPVGHPSGTDDLNYGTGIVLTPILQKVTPNIGSVGGSLIYATVIGIGNMSTGVTLVTAAGVDICSQVTIQKYGELQCLTKVNLTIADGPLSLKQGTNISACQGQTGDCNYQTSTSLVSVSTISKASDTAITIAGAGFSGFTSFSPLFRFAGIYADSVIVNSDTSATATFNNGVPLTLSTQP